MTTSTVSTRFLILSDTHGLKLENATGLLQYPTPKADVILHCGDMTMVGGVSEYKKCLKLLETMDAELKLVIAGNHDLDLDEDYFLRNFSEEDGDDPDDHADAVSVMRGPLAKAAGVTYLDEGTHTFKLSNGTTFKIYVSPYQPVFGEWAFMYGRNEDRFNLQHQTTPNVTSIATNPIPDFGSEGVNIVMTHGPPKSILDHCPDGDVGCENLLGAVSRARPLLHCFGHVHEGYGAKIVTWEDENSAVAGKHGNLLVNAYPESNHGTIRAGKETLMVNAAIMDHEYKPDNAPWLVSLDLPLA
jgi:hypothetical protein